MIAAVLESFPETTQTFHHHRLAELQRRGVLDSIWFVRSANGTLPDGCESLREVAFEIPKPSFRQLRQFATTDFVRDIARAPNGQNGERGRAGAFKYGAFGASLADELAQRPTVTRVHAMFAATSATTAVVAASLSGLKLSVEVHSPQSLVTNKAWLQAKLRRADDIIAISEYSSAAVRQLAPEVPVHVVRCGLPDRPEPPATSGAAAIDLIAVGSLIPKKGHSIAVEAAALLGRHLTIVGDGPLRGELASIASQLDAKVTFLGTVPSNEVRALLSRAKVGVLACVRSDAGDEDGIPVAIMEYLQAGLPTASTAIAGIPELLRDESVGSLAASNDAEAFAAAIERAEQHGGDARESRLPEEFRLATSCDALVEALDMRGSEDP